MRSKLSYAGAVLLITLISGIAYARLTGTNLSTDIDCNGPVSSEVCLIASGHFIPTTTNTQTLGSASFVWSNVYATAVTATNLIASGYTQLATQTTTQIVLRTDPVGSTFLIQERVAGALVSNTYNICTSTANAVASYVYVATSTGAAAIAALGGACNK